MRAKRHKDDRVRLRECTTENEEHMGWDLR